jgi:hypothetical protein
MSQCDVCIVCCAVHSTHAATSPNNNITECFNIKITLARLNFKLPNDCRRPKHVVAILFYVNFNHSVNKCASVGEWTVYLNLCSMGKLRNFASCI